MPVNVIRMFFRLQTIVPQCVGMHRADSAAVRRNTSC